MASIFKRGKSYYVRFINEAGEWTQESCGHVSRGEAEIIKNKKEAISINRRHKEPIRIVETTLLEQLKIYRDQIIRQTNDGRKKAAATIIRFQQVITNFIEYIEAHGWKSFADITTDRVGDFFQFLSDTQSASSVILHRLEIIKFYTWAMRHHFTGESPMVETKNPKITRNKILRFFSDAELKRIFANAKENYQPLFRFLYLTGLRIGELGNAEWSHFRTTPPTLYIPVMDGNKAKRETSIPLSAEALSIIQDQKRITMQYDTEDARKYIFVNRHGNKCDNANIYSNLKVVLKKCKITGAHPHTFRHTFASHLAIKGVPLIVIRDLMRHRSIEETQIYAHLSDSATRDATNLLSAPQPTLNLREFKAKSLAANAG